jgi:hypothetical protein
MDSLLGSLLEDWFERSSFLAVIALTMEALLTSSV